MRTFFQSILGSCLGVLIAFLVLFLILFGIGASVYSSKDAKPSVSANSVLYLKLDKELPELTNNTESVSFTQLADQGKNLSVHDYAKLVERAGEDKKIKGIYIHPEITSLSLTKLRVLEEAMKKFKESGKFIFAYSDYYTGSTYSLATMADEIVLFPSGGIDLRGLASVVPHFKDLADKAGIEFETYFAGKFKSATEPFRLDHMSDANKLQTRSYLNSLYENMVNDIMENRGLDRPELEDIIDRFLSRDAESAKQSGLIDQIMYEDEMLDLIRGRLGLEEDDKIRLVSPEDYYKSDPLKTKLSEKNKIALVYAEGSIHDGPEKYGSISGQKYVEILRKIRKDKNVKAVVLRVDSPGGSALASEKIWRELKLIREEGIPVVASMGTYAASGGYYIASGAEYITAEPTTITGSIGVFTLIPKVNKLFNEKLGVNMDTVRTNDLSAAFLPFFPSSPEEKEILQDQVDDIYETFLARVSEARSMSRDEVNEIAQGRVWTGEQAIDINLVDELNTLDGTVQKAAELADISEYRIAEYPQLKDPLMKMLERFLDGGEFSAKIRMLQAKPVETWQNQIVDEVREISQPQARMPMEILWH